MLPALLDMDCTVDSVRGKKEEKNYPLQEGHLKLEARAIGCF